MLILRKTKLAVPMMLSSLPITAMSVLLPIYTSALGLTPLQVTGLFSIFSLGMLIVRFFIGQITDKFGRKPVFIFALICYAVSYSIYSIANALPLFYLARCMQAVATAFIGISTFSMVADISENNGAQNFGKISAYTNQGGLIGIGLCFYFLKNNDIVVGWTGLFAFCTVAAVVAVLYSLIYLKETKIQTQIPADKPSKISFPPQKIKILWFDLYFQIFVSILNSIFVLYVQSRFGAEFLQIAIAFMLPAVVTAFTTPILGKISDKAGHNKSIAISLLFTAVSLPILLLVDNIYIFSAIWTITTVAINFFAITINAMFVDGIEPEKRGTAIGSFTMVLNAGGMIGPVLGGYVFQTVDINAPFIMCTVVSAALIFLGLKWFPIAIKEKSPPSAI